MERRFERTTHTRTKNATCEYDMSVIEGVAINHFNRLLALSACVARVSLGIYIVGVRVFRAYAFIRAKQRDRDRAAINREMAIVPLELMQ